MRLSDLQSFASRHPWLGTPQGARARCLDASLWFLASIGRGNDCLRDNGDDSEEGWHTYVCVDGVCVDWTARQFDPSAPFPRVWLDRR